MNTTELREDLMAIRELLAGKERRTRKLMNHPCLAEPEDYQGQRGKIKANIMLAVRHIEDAGLRLGLALQTTANAKPDEPTKQGEPR